MRAILILSLTAWLSLVVLAVYEWKFLVAGCLVALLFVFKGMGRHRVPSPPLGSHQQKEDDAP